VAEQRQLFEVRMDNPQTLLVAGVKLPRPLASRRKEARKVFAGAAFVPGFDANAARFIGGLRTVQPSRTSAPEVRACFRQEVVKVERST